MWTLYITNPDHWVPISTVASFKRMREFAPLGVEWVAKALRISSDLEVDETNTKVRRTTEIQEPKDQFERSIYAVSAVPRRIVDFNILRPERIWRRRIPWYPATTGEVF
jgi:hypothetical protein